MSDSSGDEFVVVNPVQDVETILMKEDVPSETAAPAPVEAFVEEYTEQLVESVDEPKRVPLATKEGKEFGLKSVMPSTMAKAQEIVDAARPIIQDVAECGTAVAAAAATTKILNKPTDSDVVKAAALGSVSGKAVGQGLGDGMQWLFPLVARYCGAHQCDHCGKANLYTYYKKKSGEDKDLCHECFGKLGSGVDSQLDKTFSKDQMEEHDNTMFTLRIFLIGLAAAIVLKQVWLLVFGK